MSTDLAKPLVDLAAEINAEHDAATQKAAEAVEHASRAGKLLIDAKGQVQHGEWLPWLESNCSVSARQAQRYMRLAVGWSMIEKNDMASHLTMDGALRLMSGKLEVHPLKEYLIPRMTHEEFEGLTASISRNGLRHPIIVDRRLRIIDGRERYHACRRAGVEPTFDIQDIEDDEDVKRLIISLDIMRTHLTKDQKAAILASYEEYLQRLAAQEDAADDLVLQ